jgi:phospholipid/cholesterol/gamma-HCH transport system ATP-binding protein
VIRIENLHKSFGTLQVLRGISLEVPYGKTLAVLGRSGTGKSVLLKCLVRLIEPDQGQVYVDGEEITALEMEELSRVRQRIGFVFQNAALYDSMTVAENLDLHLRRHLRLPPAERLDIIVEKLRFVGMEHALDKYPAELSGGMQKRVGLARAMVLDPEIMLYDEPTTGLDPITAAEIDELIENTKIEKGVTAIIITHDLRSASRTADETAVLHQGKIVAKGKLEDLVDSEDPFVRAFLAGLAVHKLSAEL